ncbi:MAG: MFS transporter [Clostridiales bacterium]|nr:MFS transporter [Clostridiales bacterium]
MTDTTKPKFFDKILGVDPTDKNSMQSKEVISYSIAGLGQNIICQLVTTFFMYYLTTACGINDDGIMYLAYMFLFARLFDAFNDPIMGTIVDRTKSRWGKMRPYLLFSPIPIAIFTVLLFTTLPGEVSQSAKLAYSTIIYLLWGIAYTSVDVPYWGLASSMTSDTNKRNTMLTVARLFCTIGSGLVSVVIPIITGNLGTDASVLKTAYLIIAIVSVLIAVPPFFLGFKNTKERYFEANKEKESLKDNIKLLFKNKPILLMIAIGVVGSLRTIYMTTALYYASVNLGNTALASAMFMLVVPGGLVATLLTPYLSKKFGKRNVFLWSHLVGGILLIGLYFLGYNSEAGAFDGTTNLAIIMFYIIIILAGIPTGFSNILTYSMIGDSIDYLEDKTGKRAEGICYAMQTLISKIGMALTAFVTLLVLGKAGYATVTAGGQISADSPELAAVVLTVKSNIWLVTTLACGISMAACAIPLLFYDFNEKEQAEAVARVAARKAAMNQQAEMVEATVTVDEQNEAKGLEAGVSEIIGDIISDEPTSTDDTKKE